jgi:hypothetical protein
VALSSDGRPSATSYVDVLTVDNSSCLSQTSQTVNSVSGGMLSVLSVWE